LELEIKKMAAFLSGVSPLSPWHVTAFHQDYRMTDPQDTTAETLMKACAIGQGEGLKYVYAGNLPGRVGEWENTRCHHCSETVIERSGYRIMANRLKEGNCPNCGTQIPGRF
jgi:pyruvate formate lyase activating enzyme